MLSPPPSSSLFPYTTLFRSWLGRSFGQTGRINKSGDGIRLTSNLIKQKIGIPLNQQEQLLESKLRAGEIARSEEHTSELQSRGHLVCRLLLEKKNKSRMRVL